MIYGRSFLAEGGWLREGCESWLIWMVRCLAVSILPKGFQTKALPFMGSCYINKTILNYLSLNMVLSRSEVPLRPIFQSYNYKMWYLNYCSPFIYGNVGTSQIIRYILYSCIAVEFLVYIFYIVKYKWFGEVIKLKNKLQEHNEEDQDLHIVRQAKSYPGMGEKQYRMDQKKFKEWYLHYFGLHSVAVAGCIMYSPYFPQLVFTILHTILFPIASAMQSCLLVKTSRIIFNVILSIVVLLDIMLLFSLSMGVGASGYDSNAKNCYLLQ